MGHLQLVCEFHARLAVVNDCHLKERGEVKKSQVERLQSEISTGFWHRPYNFLMNGEDLALYQTLCQLEFNNFLQEVPC